MNRTRKVWKSLSMGVLIVGSLFGIHELIHSNRAQSQMRIGAVSVRHAKTFDVSPPLASIRGAGVAVETSDCVGKACGTSPGDSDAEQKPEEVEPLPTVTDAT